MTKGPQQMAGWDNPDVGLLYDINGLTERTPGWLDRAMAFMGEYGLLAMLALLLVWAWWRARRQRERGDATLAMAGLAWAVVASGIAYLVTMPIQAFVKRPRPFQTYEGLDVLVAGETGFSFVSEHSTAAMAVGVGLYMVGRRLGILAISLALLQGLSRTYLGVHYPTDVVGGLALGTAVALLLAPGGMAVLTPLTRWLAGTWAGCVVHSRRRRGRAAPASTDVSGLGVPQAGSRGGLIGEKRSGDENLAA